MSSGLDAAERLKSELGSLLEAGRSVAREYGAAGGSFRRLLLSDISLARVALIRGLVFLLLCVIMVGTAWATAMVLLVVGLQQAGLPWLLALAAPLLVSLGIAVMPGAWRARRWPSPTSTPRAANWRHGFHPRSPFPPTRRPASPTPARPTRRARPKKSRRRSHDAVSATP